MLKYGRGPNRISKAKEMLSAEFARMLGTEQNAHPLLGKPGGRIINLTSGRGKGPMPGNLAYAATKGAISVFTESLAAEPAPLHITVNAVDPGPTDTGWMSEEVKKAMLPRFPMGGSDFPKTRPVCRLSWQAVMPNGLRGKSSIPEAVSKHTAECRRLRPETLTIGNRWHRRRRSA